MVFLSASFPTCMLSSVLLWLPEEAEGAGSSTSRILLVSVCDQQTKLTPCFKRRKNTCGSLQVAPYCSERPDSTSLGDCPGQVGSSPGKPGRGAMGTGPCCVPQFCCSSSRSVQSPPSTPGCSRLQSLLGVAGCQLGHSAPLRPVQVEAPWGEGWCWRCAGQRDRAGAAAPASLLSVLCISSSLFPGRSNTGCSPPPHKFTVKMGLEPGT